MLHEECQQPTITHHTKHHLPVFPAVTMGRSLGSNLFLPLRHHVNNQPSSLSCCLALFLSCSLLLLRLLALSLSLFSVCVSRCMYKYYIYIYHLLTFVLAMAQLSLFHEVKAYTPTSHPEHIAPRPTSMRCVHE